MSSLPAVDSSPISLLDVRSNWAQITQQKSNPRMKVKETASLARDVYQNTLNSPFPFVVIGMNEIRKDEHIKKNICLITGRTSEGAVLGEQQWSTLINDVFMIGAVNSGKEVHTTHSRIPIGFIWDHKKSRLTSIGRELAILRLAEYSFKILQSKSFKQFLLVPPCREAPMNLSYKQVVCALNAIRSEADAKAFILGGGNCTEPHAPPSEMKN
jgi:hypothetical protein